MSEVPLYISLVEGKKREGKGGVVHDGEEGGEIDGAVSVRIHLVDDVLQLRLRWVLACGRDVA